MATLWDQCLDDMLTVAFGKGELELEEAGSYLMSQWLETIMTSML